MTIEETKQFYTRRLERKKSYMTTLKNGDLFRVTLQAEIDLLEEIIFDLDNINK